MKSNTRTAAVLATLTAAVALALGAAGPAQALTGAAGPAQALTGAKAPTAKAAPGCHPNTHCVGDTQHPGLPVGDIGRIRDPIT